MEKVKKKIFLCITKGDWGGAQKYVFDLATNLPTDDFDVSVVFGNPGLLAEKIKGEKINTIVLRNSHRDSNPIKDIALFFELKKLFKKEKPDIVHLNSSKMGFVGSVAVLFLNWFGLKSRRNKIKTVFTIHGWAFNEDRPWWQKCIFWAMQIKTVFYCNKSIAVSQAVKERLKPKWLQRKIEVIHNGIREENILPKEEAIKILINKIPQNIDGRKIIGTISELHKNKGLKYLIKAFSLLDKEMIDNNIIVIIGEGEERKNLEDLVKRLGLNDNIFLIGKIENAGTLLSALEAFTLTSITEAFPYVLLEAGKASLPVIASNVGGIPEIIESNEYGILVNPRDERGISKAIRYILDNPEKARKLGLNLREKVVKEFSIGEMIKKTVDIYKSFCDII
jgi:glycosyltransferase involved in cell wall biosynthesis